MALGRMDVHPLPPFIPLSSPTTLSKRWSVWKKCFETYLAAQDITDKTRSAHFSYIKLDKRLKKFLKHFKTEVSLMTMTVPSASSMHIFLRRKIQTMKFSSFGKPNNLPMKQSTNFAYAYGKLPLTVDLAIQKRKLKL